jgi:myo-inositol-1(or 4)-monophosphatase
MTMPSRGAAAGLLELATSVAVAAGRLLLGSGGRPEVVATKSSPTDVVTEADRAAEALIRDLIGAARPGDRILGEEGGETGGAGAEGAGGEGEKTSVRWIVDPLDGTVNYLYGLPDWAVSIAAEADGTVVAGAVFVPPRDELFSAALGGGAWLSRGALDWRGEDAPQPVRLACNTGVPLDRALVATGFGYEAGRRLIQGEVLAGVLPRVRDIRRGGSAAVDLCSVASGGVDAYYERGVNLWDIAAGGLIAAEAGARVTGLHGRPAGSSMTVAATPPLLGELHDLLASLDPERDG